MPLQTGPCATCPQCSVVQLRWHCQSCCCNGSAHASSNLSAPTSALTSRTVASCCRCSPSWPLTSVLCVAASSLQAARHQWTPALAVYLMMWQAHAANAAFLVSVHHRELPQLTEHYSRIQGQRTGQLVSRMQCLYRRAS
jgi:hypothetical protein